MDYIKLYNTLIETRKVLNRSKKTGFYEKHHIIPKCIGGDNKQSNLILLTPKEHYIAHLLLTKMYDGKTKAKMCYALVMMCVKNNKQYRISNSRQFEYAKKLVSENCRGENASGYGKTMSDENKEKFSIRMTNDNPSHRQEVWNKGKKLPPLSDERKEQLRISSTGKKHTDESKKIMSEKAKGRTKSEEHKKKLSKANIGKKQSKETIQKRVDKMKGVKQKTVKCPFCEKEGGISVMKKCHFEKCKNKK